MLLLAAVLFCCSAMPVSAKNSSASKPASTRNDADGDGVKDKRDKCANTPKGVAVSADGCPLDGDKDGVPDYQDKCPRYAGTTAMFGCPDKDKDGVADNVDV